MKVATKIAIRLEFVYDSDKSVEFTDCVNHERDSTKKGRENLAREVLAELRKAVSFADHLAVLPSVPNLADSSNYVRTDPMAFMDSFNVPALWLEISNTFIDLRNLLALAKAYKSVEPLNTTPLSDSLCAHVHFEKMYKLNLAVYQLVKIQDLVVRLLQEGFSGKLIAVDYDDEDWELKLTLQAAKQGLATLRKSGKLAKKEYEEIMTALGQPSKSPHRKTVLNYRNRLTHGYVHQLITARFTPICKIESGRSFGTRQGG